MQIVILIVLVMYIGLMEDQDFNVPIFKDKDSFNRVITVHCVHALISTCLPMIDSCDDIL